MIARKRKVSDTVIERLTRSEEQIIAHAERDVNNHKEVMQAVSELKVSLEAIEERHHERLVALEKEYERYRGAWGLLTIIGTALLAAWSIISEVIKRKIGIAE
jgi:hypothetical protein